MGDKDGARELLDEVLKEGSEAHKARPALSSSAFERLSGTGLRFFRNLSPAVWLAYWTLAVVSVQRLSGLALAGA